MMRSSYEVPVVFHIYDSDANGFLDKTEIDGIIEQMMNVARYQQWDTIELEQIIRQMMVDIDYDNDGIVSYEEWRRGGLTNIPLLVLLGFDTVRECSLRTSFSFIFRKWKRTDRMFGGCDISRSQRIATLVVAFSSDGEENKDWVARVRNMPFYEANWISFSVCKYTVHERCVRSAATNCIRTFSSRQQGQSVTLMHRRFWYSDKLYHHWQDANATAKCVKCRTTVGVFQGKGCRWCHNYVSS